MARPKSPLVWILIVVGGASALCCSGTLGLMVLGLISGSDTDSPGAVAGMASPADRARAGKPGEPGGFAFDAPQGWKTQADGRFITEWTDSSNLLGVEALRLQSVPGLEDGEGKLLRMWRERVGADWADVNPNPPAMRRFVTNGARAFFTAAVVTHKTNGKSFRVTLMLVEADTRFEPLVFIQSFSSPGAGEAMSASFSWNTSHQKVEEALKGVRGSPVGLPLADDAELVGDFTYSTSSAAQWATAYGGTTMTAVSYAVQYILGADHTYQYKYSGASGVVGAMTFGSEDDRGTWSIHHDILTLTGEKRPRRYLIVGAGHTPEGKRFVILMPEHPRWSLYPGALSQDAQMFVATQ
ncbi:hypothetical protein [Corallococcus terminator]|uniref:Uncharacterized protein n=1 Tax=Corallococcus terminator TaxID=2316733 RepID=A0A3A8IEE0_9BACT|nr:hypothetical protein [Corallococcus terminator]RKG75973.1 hypothetical protein D7V88_32855 [Corallococcus terminator]